MNMTNHIIDSHCHLDFPKFNRDREEVIQRALNVNVGCMINSGIDYKTNISTLRLADEFEHIYPTLGLSPMVAARKDRYDIDEILFQIEENLDHAAGIGEAGLDYHHYTDPRLRQNQVDVFHRVVDIAETADIPLVVHARKGEEEVLNIVEGLRCVVFHCYSGSLETLDKIINAGHYISIPSLTCYSNHHREIARNTPLDRMVLETDSPYLSPRKNKRNEPSHLVDSLPVISQLHDTDEKKVAHKTAKNTGQIFGIRL